MTSFPLNKYIDRSDILVLFPDAPCLGQAARVDRVAPFSSNSEKTLLFVNKWSPTRLEQINSCRECLILMPLEHLRDAENYQGSCELIFTANPRLAVVRILERHSQRSAQIRADVGIHPTAFIHPEAEIDSGASIGPGCYVGRSRIGKNARLYPNVTVLDDVEIGDNFVSKPGSVIGGDGFGFEENENGVYEKFHHLAGVTIGHNVEIGANCCIDRGALENTVLEDGVKLDNLVHVAHNCYIGRNTVLTANTVFSGSVKVGEGVWTAPGSLFVQGIKIHDKSFVGIGAIATKDLEPRHRLIPSFSTIKAPRG